MPLILSPDSVLDRPGVGIVISSSESLVSPFRGVVGFLGRARMGPLNTPIRCSSVSDIQRIFGGGPYGGGNGNTTDAALEALRGGAVAVWVTRMGAGGTLATLNLTEVALANAVRVD